MPLLSGILDIHGVAGYGGIKASDCQTKGCCYDPAPATTGAALVTLPACFYPNGGDSSFSLSGALQSSGKLRAASPHHITRHFLQLKFALCLLPAWHPVLQTSSPHMEGRAATGNTPQLLHSTASRLMLGLIVQGSLPQGLRRLAA